MTADPKSGPRGFSKLALIASPTDRAQEAAASLAGCHEWVPIDQAQAAVVLGGDGFMLTAFSAWIALLLLAAGLIWIISRLASRR